MGILLFRLLLIIAIFLLIYSTIKYLLNPKRKLELAHEKKQFYFHDDKNNIRKNFLVTYKGVLFEGEKYLGTTENSFEVVSVYIWSKNNAKLQGFDREDFHFIEEHVLQRYPNTKIEWKSPIKEFLKNN